MSRFKPHIALLICNIVWAMDYPFYNIVLPHYVHPMAMVAGSVKLKECEGYGTDTNTWDW